MTRLYKLTDERDQTHRNTQWGVGIEHTASGRGNLCGRGFIHAYTDPLLAVLLNPIHANIPNPILWEAEGEVIKTDHGLKVGCTRLKTVRQIPLPVITIEQKIRFGILCPMEVYDEEVYDNADWTKWAVNWLSGKDRTQKSAAAAHTIAYAADADVAAYATAAAYADVAAYAAAAANAADAAATDIKHQIDLIAIAKRAMGE